MAALQRLALDLTLTLTLSLSLPPSRYDATSNSNRTEGVYLYFLPQVRDRVSG